VIVKKQRRTGRMIGWALLVAIVALIAVMLREAAAIPVLREAYVEAPDWPRGEKPVRIAALSDIDAGWPDATPARLARVVDQVQAQRPDLIVITGDFLSQKIYGLAKPDAALAPLGALHAPFGVFAVAGDQEHIHGLRRVATALRRMGITLLSNDAVRRGPLAIVGIDDGKTEHDDIAKAFASQQRVGGVPVVLTHSPVLLPWMPPSVRLFLSGHTHCGQILLLPWLGPITGRGDAPMICGAAHYREIRAIVGAGIGTRGVPMRLNAPPDWWLVTIGPRRSGGSSLFQRS